MEDHEEYWLKCETDILQKLMENFQREDVLRYYYVLRTLSYE